MGWPETIKSVFFEDAVFAVIVIAVVAGYIYYVIQEARSRRRDK